MDERHRTSMRPIRWRSPRFFHSRSELLEHAPVPTTASSGSPILQQPYAYNVSGAIRSCAIRSALTEGRLLHSHIIKSYGSLCLSVAFNNELINMYGKCGSMEDAASVFSRMLTRDVVSWNSMIAAYILYGHNEEALHYFNQMQDNDMGPDNVTCISILSACVHQTGLEEGMKVHNLVLMYGFDLDVVVQNAVINMYGRLGCLWGAEKVFNGTPQDDIISWNTMMSIYIRNGQEDRASHLFAQLQQKAIPPNRITYISIISVLANLVAGKQVHAIVEETDHCHDFVVSTSLMNMYGKGGKVEDACKVFDKMPVRNVVSWNCIIDSYSQSGQSKLAQQLFHQMHQENIIPSRLTFVNILDTCVCKATSHQGKRLHVLILGHGLVTDPLVGNALVNMYGKCSRLDMAWQTFNSMNERNESTWNVMISRYAQSEYAMESLKLYLQMLQEGSLPDRVTFLGVLEACASELSHNKGKQVHSLLVANHMVLDVIVGNSLMNFYSKLGEMDMAQELFDKLSEHDVISWSALIAGFAQQAQSKEAIFVLRQMCQDGVFPNKITFVSVLAACSCETAQLEAKRIHAIIWACGFEEDTVIDNALINLYGKCGIIQDARVVFDIMLKKDMVSWTAMIAMYAQHGDDEHTLELFNRMQQQNVKPNRVTFLSVISAWGHTGKVDEGLHWFLLMDQKFGISPGVDHYNCVIDLFGRAGRLDEAEKLVSQMPTEMTIVSIMALLSACKSQADTELGECFAQLAFALFPDHSEPYIMLANIYSSNGRAEDASRVMSSMREKGLEDLMAMET